MTNWGGVFVCSGPEENVVYCLSLWDITIFFAEHGQSFGESYLQSGHWRDDVLQINQVSDQNSWMNWGWLDLDGLGWIEVDWGWLDWMGSSSFYWDGLGLKEVCRSNLIPSRRIRATHRMRWRRHRSRPLPVKDHCPSKLFTANSYIDNLESDVSDITIILTNMMTTMMMTLKQASLSSPVWKGAGRPSLFWFAVEIAIIVANSSPDTWSDCYHCGKAK